MTYNHCSFIIVAVILWILLFMGGENVPFFGEICPLSNLYLFPCLVYEVREIILRRKKGKIRKGLVFWQLLNVIKVNIGVIIYLYNKKLVVCIWTGKNCLQIWYKYIHIIFMPKCRVAHKYIMNCPKNKFNPNKMT